MAEKKVFVVERSLPVTGGENKFYVKASDIGSVHRWGREKLGPGVSFSTRDPKRYETPYIENGFVKVVEI